MNRHDKLQKDMLDLLEESDGLSQLALLCRCYGYRHAHGKLLYFSVRERQLKQEEEFGEAQKLLVQVIEEADAEYKRRAEEAEIKEAKREKRQARSKALTETLELVEPPKEVVTAPASRRLVSGNPLVSNSMNQRLAVADATAPQLGAAVKGLGVGMENVKRLQAAGAAVPIASQSFASFGVTNLSDHLRHVQAIQDMAAYVPNFLREAVYETIPERRTPSPYQKLDDALSERLDEYPKVVWQKLASERRFIEDDELGRHVRNHRQAVKRAVDALVKSGQVEKEGELTRAVYTVVRR